MIKNIIGVYDLRIMTDREDFSKKNLSTVIEKFKEFDYFALL